MEDIQAGEMITKDNLRSIRPGMGISPKYYDDVIGRKVNQDVKRGTAFNWKLV